MARLLRARLLLELSCVRQRIVFRRLELRTKRLEVAELRADRLETPARIRDRLSRVRDICLEAFPQCIVRSVGASVRGNKL